MARIIEGVSPDAMVWLMDAVVDFNPSMTYVAAGMKFNTKVPQTTAFTATATGTTGFTLKSPQTAQFQVSFNKDYE